jgi:hypothetical protein
MAPVDKFLSEVREACRDEYKAKEALAKAYYEKQQKAIEPAQEELNTKALIRDRTILERVRTISARYSSFAPFNCTDLAISFGNGEIGLSRECKITREVDTRQIKKVWS